MSRLMFVNLPVKDLQRSVAFFTKLGFEFNAQFTDESATCMIVSDKCFVMLLAEPRFQGFTSKKICDTTHSVEALFAISAESREEVDDLVHKALAAGGKPAEDPQDHGYMYGWSFQDLDHHVWEVTWMDPSAVQQ